MSARNHTLGRRRLLQGLGAAAFALPFLRHMPSAMAAAPKRFVVFFTPNESIDKAHWDPKVGNGAALPATLPTVFKELDAHRSNLVMIGDLKNKVAAKSPEGGGHQGIGHMLTGRINKKFGPGVDEFWSTGISLDQYIGQAWGVEPLTLGAMPGGGAGNSRIAYTGEDQPVSPYEDPQLAFDKTFGDPDLSEVEKQAYRQQQTMVLDAAAVNLSRLKDRLPKADASKLELHLDGVLALQKKLTEVGPVCTPTILDKPGGYNYKKNEFLPQTVRLHIDVLVQALACGTRIGSLQIGNTGASSITPVWPAEGININIDAHNISHNYNSSQSGTNKDNREAMETWYLKQFSYFLQKLTETPEGDGTFLIDNTLVLWCKGFATKHSDAPHLYMLAGKAGGALKTNRYLSFDGVAHNNLLASICQLMDLTDETFGDPEVCTGSLDLS